MYCFCKEKIKSKDTKTQITKKRKLQLIKCIYTLEENLTRQDQLPLVNGYILQKIAVEKVRFLCDS